MDLKSVCQKGTPYKARQRVGRGIGSGKGKTSSRGHKGWGARSGSSRRPGYEGGQMPIYRRVPNRGFTNARFRTDYTTINVEKLDAFDDGATVDLQSILDKGLVSLNTKLLKVLGNGELKKKLTVHAQKFSKSAAEKIKSAGGTIAQLDAKGRDLENTAVLFFDTKAMWKRLDLKRTDLEILLDENSRYHRMVELPADTDSVAIEKSATGMHDEVLKFIRHTRRNPYPRTPCHSNRQPGGNATGGTHRGV